MPNEKQGLDSVEKAILNMLPLSPHNTFFSLDAIQLDVLTEVNRFLDISRIRNALNSLVERGLIETDTQVVYRIKKRTRDGE